MLFDINIHSYSFEPTLAVKTQYMCVCVCINLVRTQGAHTSKETFLQASQGHKLSPGHQNTADCTLTNPPITFTLIMTEAFGITEDICLHYIEAENKWEATENVPMVL